MRRSRFGILALAALVPLAACDDSTGTDGPSTLSLFLTDAPGDVAAAVVTIDRIELVGDDGVIDVTADESYYPYTVDLVTLQEDVAQLAAGVTVPNGSYSQLRLIVSGGCVAAEGANAGEYELFATEGYGACPAGGDLSEGGMIISEDDLHMPSYLQTGIKVNLPGGTLELEATDQQLLLDWDVAASFGRESGNSGRWTMHPVVHAADVAFTGSITVELMVDDEAEEGAVTLDEGAGLGDYFEAQLNEETPIALTDDDEDGVYTATFSYLLPSALGDGEYEVTLVQIAEEDLAEGLSVFEFTLSSDNPQMVDLGSAQDALVIFEVSEASVPASE